jgi:hypothetical protein
MDEQALVDRIHDALDVEPRQGAYERLRIALEKTQAKPQTWPMFATRWSRMSFRLAAGLALIALTIAVIAALMVTHRSPTGGVPAGSGRSVAEYQKMISADYATAAATWSSPCDTTVHTGCQADASRAQVALQQWLDDLNRSEPPARFAVVDAQLRAHLSESLTGLNALLAAISAQNPAGIDRAYEVGLDGRQWTDAAVSGIQSSQQTDAAAYTASVRLESNALTSCSGCQELAGQTTTACAQALAQSCEDLLAQAAIPMSGFQTALVEVAAPASLSAKDAQLQQDLALADTALIAMNETWLAGDSAGFDAGRTALQRALAAVNRDTASVLNG